MTLERKHPVSLILLLNNISISATSSYIIIKNNYNLFGIAHYAHNSNPVIAAFSATLFCSDHCGDRKLPNFQYLDENGY